MERLMTIDITPTKALPWILFMLTLLGYIWTASSINAKLEYLMNRDREERVYMLSKMNENYLKVTPSVKDTTK
jgi:hypothetical protein